MEVGGELRNAGAPLLTSSGHVTLALAGDEWFSFEGMRGCEKVVNPTLPRNPTPTTLSVMRRTGTWINLIDSPPNLNI